MSKIKGQGKKRMLGCSYISEIVFLTLAVICIEILIQSPKSKLKGHVDSVH